MQIPKFLLADNTDFAESIFIIHTEYPAFIIDLSTDEVEWLEELEEDEEAELTTTIQELIEQASAFYDREIRRYDS